MKIPIGTIIKPIRKALEYILIKDKPADVTFRMKDPYLPQRPNPEARSHAELITIPSPNSRISSFAFIDTNSRPIGYAATFGRLTRNHNYEQTNYHFCGSDDRRRFLESVIGGSGKIKALVSTSNGENFIFTYGAKTDNWKEVAKTKHPTLNDVFELIDKKRKFW